jgi:3-phenylpropionate/trans-cinnamate dioxygenase ferredoxin subunit
MEKELIVVANVRDIAPGQIKVVTVDRKDIGIANVAGTFYAFADICTHDDGPLAEGELDGCEIACPRHGARFDISTGAVLSFPAVAPIPVYAVQVEGDDIKISRTPRG